MIIVINNFFTEEQCSFWRKYCNYACNNDTLEVNLVTGEKNEKVNRNYYTLRSEYEFMREIKNLVEKNWKIKVNYQKNTYGHIMHYKTPGQGLKWHAEPRIATVSTSINISPSWDYKGAELQFKDENIEVPYKALVMYDSSIMHRVTDLKEGQKKSIVMWLK